jgi:hypothetical protein
MEELLQAIANSSIEQQVSLLPQALEYGESGIDFLIDSLKDPELEVRAKAYELLQHNQSQKVQQAIAPGLLINPGDKIYYIQESTVFFTDESYILSASKDSVRYLDTQDEYSYQDYKIVRFDQEVYVISYVPYYTNYQQAKLHATSIQKERILQRSVTMFDIENDFNTIEQWCNLHQISKEVGESQKEIPKEIQELLQKPKDLEAKVYWSTVEEYLKSIGNLDLLNQLWQDLVGSLVSVCEVNFARKTYLSIDAYYSQMLDPKILAERKSYIGFFDEEEDEDGYFSSDFLISEKAETSFLLSTLCYSNLTSRSLAYQLLKGINLDKAQQAIHQGVQLNSGDKIYSVYQSGVGYTDTIYYVLIDDTDDIGYIEQLRNQITNSHEYDPRVFPQRRYCFTDKKQAEEAAETLHRKLIKEQNYALEWRKENPNFNLKKWCIDNNIAYKDYWEEHKLGGMDSYEAIFRIKELIADDEQLSDNLRRSRYIYHPKHMDTWCKDNDICYEQICDDNPPDDWHNYGKVLDYINLPENIELLSKFWKDGEGNFAFVKEEIVLRKVYIKIGEELHGQAEASKLFAVSEEYRSAAGNLLVELLENSKTKTESKLEARKILQDLDWDEIPF